MFKRSNKKSLWVSLGGNRIIMGNIWLTSDWHFNHSKDFIYKPRGFKTVQEMNFNIINNFNQLVKYDDIVYCLGDCMLEDNIKGIHCMQQLNCQNIKIIPGNHCTDTRINLYKQYGFEVIGYATPLKYKGYHFYLSHYPTITSNLDIDKPLNRRTINLCGHVHTQDKFLDMNKGLIYHVELDAHNNYPVLIDDIIEDIKHYTHAS